MNKRQKKEKERIKFLKKHSHSKYNYFHSYDYKKILNKTLFEIDKKDWLYQYSHNTTVPEYNILYLPDFMFEAYYKTKYSSLGREYVFGNITSARHYIQEKVEYKLNNYLDKRIPSILKVKSKKLKNDNFLMNFERVANGLEEEYEICFNYLLHSLYHEIEEIFKEKYLNDIKDKTFRHVQDPVISFDSPITEFIIGDIEAAKKIKIKSFFQDFEKLEQPYGVIKEIIKKIYKELKPKLKEKIDLTLEAKNVFK